MFCASGGLPRRVGLPKWQCRADLCLN